MFELSDRAIRIQRALEEEARRTFVSTPTIVTYVPARVTIVAVKNRRPHRFPPQRILIPSTNAFVQVLFEGADGADEADGVEFDVNLCPLPLNTPPILYGSLQQAISSPKSLNKLASRVLVGFLQFIGEISVGDDDALNKLAERFQPAAVHGIEALRQRRYPFPSEAEVEAIVWGPFADLGFPHLIPQPVLQRRATLTDVDGLNPIHLMQRWHVPNITDRHGCIDTITEPDRCIVEYMRALLLAPTWTLQQQFYTIFKEVLGCGGFGAALELARIYVSAFGIPKHPLYVQRVLEETDQLIGVVGINGFVTGAEDLNELAADWARRVRTLLTTWLGRAPTLRDWYHPYRSEPFVERVSEYVDADGTSVAPIVANSVLWEAEMLTGVSSPRYRLHMNVMLTALCGPDVIIPDTICTHPPSLSEATQRQMMRIVERGEDGSGVLRNYLQAVHRA